MQTKSINWKCGIGILVCLLLSAILYAKPMSTDDRLVWCHYVAWFDWNRTPSAINNYYDFPLTHPTGDQQRDYRQEIDAAIKMGIDGFLVDLVDGSVFLEQTLKLLDAASGTPFMVSVCLDGFSDPAPEYAAKVAAFLKQASESPNLARIDGKPLLATYAGDRKSADYWVAFRKELLNSGYEVFLVADVQTPADYPNCFDMHYSFNALDKTPSEASTHFPALRKGAALTSSGKWMAGLGPGYIGSWLFSGRNDYYSGFRGFDQFWSNFENAVKEQADWIHLTTWNDLDETPLQPMTYQFHSYPELTQYWISHWKGTDKPAQSPRLYLAYQREQIIGTVQRIELISLPSIAKSVTVCLELRSMAGKSLMTTPSRTIAGAKAERLDWAIPTAAFAQTPVVEPVLHVQGGSTRYSRRLPMFVLRTGWIANKSSIRVPVHEMTDGQAKLSVKRVASDTIEATVSLKSTAKLRSATLYRNDRPIGAFDKNNRKGTRYQLSLTHIQDTQIQITASGGTILNAYYALDTVSKPDLKWSPSSLSVVLRRYRELAAELVDSGEMKLDVTLDHGKPQTVTLTQLKQGSVELLSTSGQPVCRLFLAETANTAVVTPNLDVSKADLTGQWYVANTFPSDLFTVRCETINGSFFFSNTVAPFTTSSALVPTTVLNTAVTLDGGAVGGGGYDAYITPPPYITPATAIAIVHPAMVQQMKWAFDSSDPWADTAGRNRLHPGSGVNVPGYAQNPDHTPAVVLRDGKPGACIQFDGKDDILEVPIRQFPIGAYTISMDIMPTSSGVEQSVIGHVGWQSCPVLRILADGRLQAGREMSRTPDSTKYNILATSDAPLPLEVWSHVEVKLNEQTIQISVNNKLSATASGIPARDYGNLRIYLGGDGTGHMFAGKLDDIVISSVAEQ